LILRHRSTDEQTPKKKPVEADLADPAARDRAVSDVAGLRKSLLNYVNWASVSVSRISPMGYAG
jgi:hypothetical protein